MISIIFWFTKKDSYNLGNFHPDILIEAILINEKACTTLVE